MNTSFINQTPAEWKSSIIWCKLEETSDPRLADTTIAYMYDLCLKRLSRRSKSLEEDPHWCIQNILLDSKRMPSLKYFLSTYEEKSMFHLHGNCWRLVDQKKLPCSTDSYTFYLYERLDQSTGQPADIIMTPFSGHVKVAKSLEVFKEESLERVSNFSEVIEACQVNEKEEEQDEEEEKTSPLPPTEDSLERVDEPEKISSRTRSRKRNCESSEKETEANICPLVGTKSSLCDKISSRTRSRRMNASSHEDVSSVDCYVISTDSFECKKISSRTRSRRQTTVGHLFAMAIGVSTRDRDSIGEQTAEKISSRTRSRLAQKVVFKKFVNQNPIRHRRHTFPPSA
jgi:hypothetical protein